MFPLSEVRCKLIQVQLEMEAAERDGPLFRGRLPGDSSNGLLGGYPSVGGVRVQGLGVGVQYLRSLGLGVRVRGLGLRGLGLGARVHGLGRRDFFRSSCGFGF